METGVLYVVATPIGNLDDLSPRAVRALTEADRILAEDTRHSRPLLTHFGIHTPLVAMHEHNERERVEAVLGWLRAGERVALVSDAGTPLISDPGFPLVRACHAEGIRVVPIPGPSALICALAAAGLPTDRFIFEGFPPRTSTARRTAFEALRGEPRTLLFYESSHRVRETLEDLRAVFGDGRTAVLARELTKRFETILHADLGELCRRLDSDPDQHKGEFVLLVAGAPPLGEEEVTPEAERVLRLLIDELPLKQAAALAARITGEKRNRLYKLALAWGSRES